MRAGVNRVATVAMVTAWRWAQWRRKDATIPWVLRKQDPARMETVLYVTLEVLRSVGLLAQPFMPRAAETQVPLLDGNDQVAGHLCAMTFTPQGPVVGPDFSSGFELGHTGDWSDRWGAGQ